MKNILLLPVITLLMACPTPSENVPNNAQGGQPSSNGQPMGPPPGEGGSPPPAEGGNGGNGAQPPQGDNGAPVQQPPQVPESDKPPEGGIITDSQVVQVNRIPSTPATERYTQDALASEDHVTFSGSAVCTDCDDNLILRAVRFIGPNDAPTENDLITQKKISTGDFSILIPKGEEGIALELLVDIDNSESPSVGERFAVIEMGGQLIPNKDKSNLTLDASKNREIMKPAAVPNGAPEE